jgi:predicted RNA binding protein YcfA (HicA-like mRNA interferase family)
MKIVEVRRLLRDAGWALVRTKGSHRQFKYPWLPGTVTVAGKPSLDLNEDTLRSIFKQAGVRDPRRG